MTRLVVGTAGHIDHGKSSLVQALTGIDPDRLKEEKARGITIELGFAHATIGDARIAFVDVPGHERFVRTMLAGVGGVDFVMLIVAADESVMPQTREHFDICRLLGLRDGCVVITKTTLPTPIPARWSAMEVPNWSRVVSGRQARGRSVGANRPGPRRIARRRWPRRPTSRGRGPIGRRAPADRSRVHDAGVRHGRDRDVGVRHRASVATS